ncbi:unnamed protein product, partial [Durusdinium trenchii]
FLCLLDFTQQFTSQESLQRAFGATAPPPGRSVSSVPAARPVWPPRTPAMNATPGPPVAPGTVEIAGGPKMSRSEARRLREEEEAARARSNAEAWRLGGKAKVNEEGPQEEDPKKAAERERSRSREKKETLDRLAKSAAEKAAKAAAADAESAASPEEAASAPQAPKLSKAEEAKLLMAKEKEKARLKKQAMLEAKKEEEMKKKMAILEKDLNTSEKPKYKRY